MDVYMSIFLGYILLHIYDAHRKAKETICCITFYFPLTWKYWRLSYRSAKMNYGYYTRDIIHPRNIPWDTIQMCNIPGTLNTPESSETQIKRSHTIISIIIWSLGTNCDCNFWFKRACRSDVSWELRFYCNWNWGKPTKTKEVRIVVIVSIL